MPQLDKISFVSQYFWLTIFFFLFYYIISNFFVITIFKSLKMRQILFLLNDFSYTSKLKSMIPNITNHIGNLYFYTICTNLIANINSMFRGINKSNKLNAVLFFKRNNKEICSLLTLSALNNNIEIDNI